MTSRLQRWRESLFRVPDTPHRTALAFGIGVWIAFCPLFGIHTLMALGIAYRYKLSRCALLVGAYINNPWTVAPMYMAGTALGCALLGVPPEALSGIDWDLEGGAFYHALGSTLRPFLVPFFLGNTMLGVLGGLAGYLALRSTLERRRVLGDLPR